MHAVFPFAFRFQVSMVIQEPPSEFFPAAPGISGRVPRRTSRRAIWRRSGDCSAHPGRCVLADAGRGYQLLEHPQIQAVLAR